MEYVERVRIALKLLELDHAGADLTQGELAEMVAVAGGEDVDQSLVSRWIAGSKPRYEKQRLAWARVLRADPGWLYFGPEHSDAPAPPGFDALAARLQLTDDVRLVVADEIATRERDEAGGVHEVARKRRAERSPRRRSGGSG